VVLAEAVETKAVKKITAATLVVLKEVNMPLA
jgi:hypothetical protein